jgi:hypothetical protein
MWPYPKPSRTDESTSGFMRTDIIGNEDLHPAEGYQFPQRDTPTITRNQKVSTMFPMNAKINGQAQPVSCLDEPPEPVIDAPMPQVKKHRSKLIFDTMVAVRKRQMDYTQQKRVYEAARKAAENDQEMAQVDAAKRRAQRDAEKQQRKRAELAETYELQFAEKQNRLQREKVWECDIDETYRIEDEQQNRSYAQQQARARDVAATKARECARAVHDVHIRKERERDAEIERERAVQEQDQEVQVHWEEVRKEAERRRLAKSKQRARVVEKLAEEMASQTSITGGLEGAESELARSKLDEIGRQHAAHEAMEEERRQDWLRIQREKDARKKTGRKKPYPAKRQTVDVDEFNRRQRWIENLRVQDVLATQVAEKRKREEEEIQADIAFDEFSLAERQEKFEKSLQKLQTLVPEETGIKVPTYTPSRSITKFY